MTDWPYLLSDGVPAPQTVAAWARLGLVPTEKVPLWAAYWLVAGYDGEHLVSLAGLHGDDPRDVRDVLPDALRGCISREQHTTALAVSSCLRRSAVSNRASVTFPVAGARWSVGVKEQEVGNP